MDFGGRFRGATLARLIAAAGLAILGLLSLPPPGASAQRPLANPDRPAPTPYAAAAADRGIGARALRRKLDRLIDAAGGDSGTWVYDLRAGRRLFAEDGGDGRIPASNAKLWTTAAILERLGPEANLETRVFADGRIDADGVLRGDLYLVGDGDPALADRRFARRNGLPVTPFPRLSREVKEAGVERVAGSVFADDGVFDRRRGVPDSDWGTSPYIGPLSGLSYDSGFDPNGGGFAADPALEAGKALVEDLRGRGIRVGDRTELAHAPGRVLDGDPLAQLPSPKLAALIEQTNRVSNNFFAEMLLKRLDASFDEPGTTRGGGRRVERFARREIGVGIEVSDGSGLTRSNRSSPKAIGKLLVKMDRDPAGKVFRESLALAGKEGTLDERMRGSAAEGRCEAKTGTLSGVSALSGYCDSRGGRIAFAILMNSVNVTRARELQDRMAAAMARYGG